MYDAHIKSLYERQVAYQAALCGMGAGISFGAFALVGFAYGAFDGGAVEHNPPGAALIGYLLGAFLGWVSRWGTYRDQSYDERERELEKLNHRYGRDVVAATREMLRLKKEAQKWNAFAWPFVLIRRVVRALTPVPGKAGT